MEDDDNNLQQCVPDGPQSPLLEPERLVSVAPEAAMIPNLTTAYLNRLRSIEASIRSAIASWDSSAIGSVLPAKRSGIRL